jgi:chromosome partitioning protein
VDLPVITFLNQKGGVGKTSLCHHLAGTLSWMDLRVLLVDNDPQASLTQGLLGPEATAALDPAGTVAAAYAGDLPLLEGLAIETAFARIDLVPGSAATSRFNGPPPFGDEEAGALAVLLEDAGERYDLVLIDCPPNLHLCSWAALVAATHLVVPLQAEDYGAQGLGPVRDAYERVRSEANPVLSLAGYLITMFDRRPALPRLYEQELRAAYGDQVFAAVVPRLVEFAEAIARRRPVSHYKAKGPAAAAMRAVAEELLQRLAWERCPSPVPSPLPSPASEVILP